MTEILAGIEFDESSGGKRGLFKNYAHREKKNGTPEDTIGKKEIPEKSTFTTTSTTTKGFSHHLSTTGDVLPPFTTPGDDIDVNSGYVPGEEVVDWSEAELGISPSGAHGTPKKQEKPELLKLAERLLACKTLSEQQSLKDEVGQRPLKTAYNKLPVGDRQRVKAIAEGAHP